MKTSRLLCLLPVALLGLAPAAVAQDLDWDGTWTGLWEGKSAVTMRVEGGKVTEYRALGLAMPVDATKREGAVLTFGVRMNDEMSTIKMTRNGAGADAELISPGGTRHEGKATRFGGDAVDALTTGSTPTAVPRR
jgi:hypothetical protein